MLLRSAIPKAFGTALNFKIKEFDMSRINVLRKIQDIVGNNDEESNIRESPHRANTSSTFGFSNMISPLCSLTCRESSVSLYIRFSIQSG